ncbi:MAG: DNRLRE domain-containing protein [Candidatus Krumholzibacteriia bacterium]
MLFRGSVLLVLSLFVIPSVAAEMVTLGAVKDNTLFENLQGSLSNAIGDGMFAGTTRTGARRRALIEFDIAGNIPAGATVDGAQLVLSMSKTVAAGQTVSLHRVLSDWGEGTSNSTGGGGGGGGAGAPSTTGDATWIHTFFNTDFWTNMGGDFEATTSASVLVDAEGTYIWGTTTQMVADVQMWLDNPDSNFGWVLIGNESGNQTSKRFDTREHPVAGSRPQLVVEYTGTAVTRATWEHVKGLYKAR